MMQSGDFGLKTTVFAGSWGNTIASGLASSVSDGDSSSLSASSIITRGEIGRPTNGDERIGFLPAVKLRRRAARELSEESVMGNE